MQLGPREVLLAVDIRFRRGLDVHELELAIDRIEDSIRQWDPMIAKIFVEADSLKRVGQSSVLPAQARSEIDCQTGLVLWVNRVCRNRENI